MQQQVSLSVATLLVLTFREHDPPANPLFLSSPPFLHFGGYVPFQFFMNTVSPASPSSDVTHSPYPVLIGEAGPTGFVADTAGLSTHGVGGTEARFKIQPDPCRATAKSKCLHMSAGRRAGVSSRGYLRTIPARIHPSLSFEAWLCVLGVAT